ncbi:MAG TPA: FAD-dependent oxidoreductase [Chloroflexia bacterium]|nr:FAD-dependent oxidoreductase [Chloroflexia bacterium]
MEQTIGTEARPLRVAIIGAGPAAFYAAEVLFKQSNLVCQIDMYNRFPSPFGLVREGVAPDHESIKTVTRVYDRTASNPNFRYFGNVTFGTDVTHDELKPYYDQIIYAVGAQSDRRMGIPGEDLKGSYPATIFVGWYNSHPDYRDLEFDLSAERVAVIGNGNVAMDVARILVTDPDELAKTDIADHSLEALRHSKVREVVMLGRRGPVQAAFTNPELKEFGELAGVDVVVDPAELELDEASAEALSTDKNATKNLETLRKYAANTTHNNPRRITMRFLVSPVEILGEDGNVSAIKIEKNKLVLQSDGTMKAQGTGQYETLDVGLVFRSVGYRGVVLPGVPFDEKSGTIPNVAGRVIVNATGETIPGEYVVGWAKRGPSGIIGTNKPDSAATVKSMVEDLPEITPIDDANRDRAKVAQFLSEKGLICISYEDWLKINEVEVSRGAAQGRPRVKFARVPEMLECVKEGSQVKA